MEVTKKRAAELLGVSPTEVLRMVSTGQLKGRQKTASRFSDWVIEVPDTLADASQQVERSVTDTLREQVKETHQRVVTEETEVRKALDLPLPVDTEKLETSGSLEENEKEEEKYAETPTSQGRKDPNPAVRRWWF